MFGPCDSIPSLTAAGALDALIHGDGLQGLRFPKGEQKKRKKSSLRDKKQAVNWGVAWCYTNAVQLQPGEVSFTSCFVLRVPSISLILDLSRICNTSITRCRFYFNVIKNIGSDRQDIYWVREQMCDVQLFQSKNSCFRL